MGFGVVMMLYFMVEKDIVEGWLCVVSLELISEIDIIMVWCCDSMGEVKFWCLWEIFKFFNGK